MTMLLGQALNRASRRRRYPGLQRSAADQLTVVGVGQLFGRTREFLIADDDALGASVVACTGYHLLNRRDADRLAESLALHRHRLAVLVADQVDAVVAARRGELHAPAGPLQASRDVVLELRSGHGIDRRHPVGAP